MKHHHRENQRIEQKLGRKREREKKKQKKKEGTSRKRNQGYGCQAEKKARPRRRGSRVMERSGVGHSLSSNWEEPLRCQHRAGF